MDKLYNSNFEIYLDSRGQEMTIQTSRKVQIDDQTEVAMRLINETDKRKVFAFDAFINYLKQNAVYSNTLAVWPITPSRQEFFGKPLVGAVQMSSSGDHSWSPLGISGDGSYYFDTQVNPSISISDINNFSIFISINNNTNAGFDVGASDGTNHVKFAARDSGNTKVQIGTASEVFANSDSTGIWCVNCREGSFYIYLNGTEVGGGGTSIAGSTPNYNIYLGANNDTGSPSDYTSRTYNFLSIYNGALTETQVQDITIQIEILQTIFNRGNATA